MKLIIIDSMKLIIIDSMKLIIIALLLISITSLEGAVELSDFNFN